MATDYIGLGTKGPHSYLIGQGEGRSVLDAVGAARQLPGLRLADQTVVWGHSQGGNAALWAGMLAPGYAPDDHVVGVAALAPASDLPAVAGNFTRVTGGSVFAAYVISAYSDTYHDVSYDRYVIPAARSIVRATAGRCWANQRSWFLSSPLSPATSRSSPAAPTAAPWAIGSGRIRPAARSRRRS